MRTHQWYYDKKLHGFISPYVLQMIAFLNRLTVRCSIRQEMNLISLIDLIPFSEGKEESLMTKMLFSVAILVTTVQRDSGDRSSANPFITSNDY